MSTAPVTLPVRTALDLLEGGVEWSLAKHGVRWTVVADQDAGTSRWESIHSLIIQRYSDGMHFAADYRRGLTENQDTRPWEYEEQVTFSHVVPVTRTVTEYITAEAAATRVALAATELDVPA